MDKARSIQRAELAFRVLEGKAVLLQTSEREVHVLNETGTRIWELTEEPIELGQLMAHLEQEFEAPTATVEAEVSAFVQALIAKRLIHFI